MFGGGLEGPGLLVILALVFFLFGGKKLPEMARGIGQAKREFERGANGHQTEDTGIAGTAVAAAEGNALTLAEYLASKQGSTTS